MESINNNVYIMDGFCMCMATISIPLSSYNQYTGQHCTLSSMYLVVNDDGDEELRIVIGVSCNG